MAFRGADHVGVGGDVADAVDEVVAHYSQLLVDERRVEAENDELRPFGGVCLVAVNELEAAVRHEILEARGADHVNSRAGIRLAEKVDDCVGGREKVVDSGGNVHFRQFFNVLRGNAGRVVRDEQRLFALRAQKVDQLLGAVEAVVAEVERAVHVEKEALDFADVPGVVDRRELLDSPTGPFLISFIFHITHCHRLRSRRLRATTSAPSRFSL